MQHAWKRRNALNILVTNPEEKRPLERLWDNIQIYFIEIGSEDVDWINPA